MKRRSTKAFLDDKNLIDAATTSSTSLAVKILATIAEKGIEGYPAYSILRCCCLMDERTGMAHIARESSSKENDGGGGGRRVDDDVLELLPIG